MLLTDSVHVTIFFCIRVTVIAPSSITFDDVGGYARECLLCFPLLLLPSHNSSGVSNIEHIVVIVGDAIFASDLSKERRAVE